MRTGPRGLMEVYVLTIDTRHGTDIEVHTTDAGATASVAQFARVWWPEELPDVPMPADDESIVNQYFENVDDEWCIIRPVRVQGTWRSLIRAYKRTGVRS